MACFPVDRVVSVGRAPVPALVFVVPWLLALGACGQRNEVVRLSEPESSRVSKASLELATPSADDDLSPRMLRRFAPIDAPSNEPSPLVDLGRTLYFEPLLSHDGKVSCNSCHPLASFGVTPTAKSKGVGGHEGSRNAPSTFNSAGSFRQFWDGRAASLEDQAKGPIQNPIEMNMKPEEAVAALAAIPGYQPLFAGAFPGVAAPITFENVALAIAAFERRLQTPGRWDRFLRGDKSALTAREKAGLKLFANLGCMVCHTGAYVGGNMFERLGVHAEWPHSVDRGRRQVSSDPADDMVFKVPTLRNVARTGPYFHDGSVGDLGDAVKVMGRLQLGIELTDEETALIVAWFDCLTGDPIPNVSSPALPEARRP